MATFDEIVRKTNALAARISDFTGVSKKVVLNAILYAKSLALPSQPDIIDELVFVAQMGLRFGITSRYHVQLMFEALRVPRTNIINLEDYVKMICIFLSKNLDIKIDFVFTTYNFNGSGNINLPDIVQMLKNCIFPIGDDDPSEQLKELVEMVVGQVDSNGDGAVSLEEFRNFVKRDILCLELFGKVLPQPYVLSSFRGLLVTKPPQKIKEYFVNERKKCLNEPIGTQGGSADLYPGIVLDMP